MLEKPYVQDCQQQQQGYRVNPGVSDEHSSPGLGVVMYHSPHGPGHQQYEGGDHKVEGGEEGEQGVEGGWFGVDLHSDAFSYPSPGSFDEARPQWAGENEYRQAGHQQQQVGSEQSQQQDDGVHASTQFPRSFYHGSRESFPSGVCVPRDPSLPVVVRGGLLEKASIREVLYSVGWLDVGKLDTVTDDGRQSC